MDVKFWIDYIKHLKFELECEGADTEIILGQEVVDEICDYLQKQRPRNYKDLRLFGSVVHVDFMNTRQIKVCKVCTIIQL